MESRAEVTRRYAKASKKDKGRVLDQVVDVTGWSRDNDVGGLDRPVPAGRQGHRSGQGRVHDEALAAAALVDHDLPGR